LREDDQMAILSAIIHGRRRAHRTTEASFSEKWDHQRGELWRLDFREATAKSFRHREGGN
jgi:hypothetical protein